jgi:hypothetical protein
VALRNENLEKVGNSLEVLLVVVVVGNIGDQTTCRLSLFLFFLRPLLKRYLFKFCLVLEVKAFNIFNHGDYKFIIDMSAAVRGPNLVFFQPFPPKLYCIFQTFFWTLSSENYCVRDLESLLEGVPNKLLDPLDKGSLMVRKAHDKRGKGLVEAMLIFVVELSVVCDSDGAHFVKVGQNSVRRGRVELKKHEGVAFNVGNELLLFFEDVLEVLDILVWVSLLLKLLDKLSLAQLNEPIQVVDQHLR